MAWTSGSMELVLTRPQIPCRGRGLADDGGDPEYDGARLSVFGFDESAHHFIMAGVTLSR